MSDQALAFILVFEAIGLVAFSILYHLFYRRERVLLLAAIVFGLHSLLVFALGHGFGEASVQWSYGAARGLVFAKLALLLLLAKRVTVDKKKDKNVDGSK